MAIKDDDVIRALTGAGVPLDRWLALGSHLTGYFDESGRLMGHIIEDDELSTAAVKFLLKRGQVHQLDKPDDRAK